MYITALILLALLLAPPRVARTQSVPEGTARAFEALQLTHIGGLTPLMTPAMVGRRLNGAQLGLRYGLRNDGQFRTQSVAAAGIFALGMRSTVTLNAGVVDRDCIQCNAGLMAGLGADARVYEGGDPLGTGSSITVGLSGEVGYAQDRLNDADAFAIGFGAPVTLSFATGNRESMHVVPYFTPVFGIGSLNSPCPLLGDCTKSGTRWVLGGGVGVWNPMTSVSASIGVNRVMLSDARTVFGINVVFGGR